MSISRADPELQAVVAASGESWLAGLVPGLVVFGLVAGLAADNAGFNPPSWGWAAALLLWVAGMALVLREEITLGVAELAAVAALAALTGWTLLSGTWAVNVGLAELAGDRTALYLAALAAVVLISRRASPAAIAGGVLAAATATIGEGLTSQLFPSTAAVNGVSQSGRLSAPMGYWNAMGIMAVVGVLLALGLASRPYPVIARMLAAATLPVLAVGLYLTFSRGAWVALCFGLALALAFDTRRWQLLFTLGACLPWLVLDVGVASRSPALTHIASPVGPTASQGHRLMLLMLASVLPLVAGIFQVCRLERRWRPTAGLTHLGHAAAAAVCVAAVVVPIAYYGSPVRVANRAFADFSAPLHGGFTATAKRPTSDLNNRLLSLSGNARVQMWRVALHEYEAHPLLGGGGDSYSAYWLAHRPLQLRVIAAHSLYLQTLAELGAVGLALLLIFLCIPLAIAWRVRGDPIVAVLLAAYAAVLEHAIADWDWQLPAVTLAGLLCGAGLLVAARPRWRRFEIGRRARIGTGIVILAALLPTVYLLRVNVALSSSGSSALSGNWTSAVSEAQEATSWAPWIETSWVALGEARLGQGDEADALTAFQHATRMAPNDWQAWYGISQAATGTVSKLALARARALDPQEPLLQAAITPAQRAKIRQQRACAVLRKHKPGLTAHQIARLKNVCKGSG